MNDPMNEAGWIGRIPKIPMVDEASRAGFVETLAVLEEECGMSIDFLGRNGFDRRGTLTLEMTGRYLSYRLIGDGGWLFWRCCPLDRGQWREVLVTGDTIPGRATMRGAIIAIESSGMRDLNEEQLDAILGSITSSRSTR